MRTKKFDAVDPFNPKNRLSGHIFLSKKTYGDMQITHINGFCCEQYIFGTPKILHLDKNMDNIDYEHCKVYEKIDGSNILLYRYKDAKGNTYITYKTRLSPFLTLMPYGDFVLLWKKVLTLYKKEFEILFESDLNFVFELFGSDLRILTDYHEKLDVRLLFGMNPLDGKIVDVDTNTEWTFPKAKKICEFSYESELKSVFPIIASDYEVEYNSGKKLEGLMFYFNNNSETTIFKHKLPDVIYRQKLYGDLYAEGKKLSKSEACLDKIEEKLQSYIDTNWNSVQIKRYNRVIEIAKEDIKNEVNFSLGDKFKKIEDNNSDKIVLWKTVWGSHIWGMEKSDSDKDYCISYLCKSRDMFLSTYNPSAVREYRRGIRVKTSESDEHWYELSRVVQLILKGSLSTLYGIMSPIVESTYSTALEEIRSIIKAYPSKMWGLSVLKYSRDSEKYMKRAKSNDFYLKHLRIACRDLQFGLTLLTSNRYEFLPSYAEDPKEMEDLRTKISKAYEHSQLPAEIDSEPFENYIIRWRKHRFYLDYPD